MWVRILLFQLMRTPLEQIWFDLFTKEGIQFSEQVDVGPYRADFIVDKFDIEVDGLQHKLKRHILHDRKRDKYFESVGYTVIRIPMNFHMLHKKKHQERLQKQIEEVLNTVR